MSNAQKSTKNVTVKLLYVRGQSVFFNKETFESVFIRKKMFEAQIEGIQREFERF